VTETIRINS